MLGRSGRADETWPAFRGGGDGHSRDKNLPLTWKPRGRSAESWSIRLPGYGQSSPVIWKDKVFVTSVSGPSKEHLHVLAVNFDDGAILWQRDFSATQRIEDRDSVSRGAPTPVVDAKRVYAVFESGDIVALTHQGELAWERSFVRDYGELQGPHGYASSPLLAGDLLIVQVSHSGPSYILAVDAETGENHWKVDHPQQTGWSSPVLSRTEHQQCVIVSTAGSVRALDLRTGDELWWTGHVTGNSTASPVVAGDLVIIGVGFNRGSEAGSRPGDERRRVAPGVDEDSATNLPDEAKKQAAPRGSLAIRLGGRGDISDSHIVWQVPQVTVGYASPVVVNDCAYFINRVGAVQCVDVHTGAVHWQHRLPGQSWASPVANDGHVVFFTKDGTVMTLKAGRDVVEIGESTISTTDIVYGVAAANGSWVIRTGRGLLRISGQDAKDQSPKAGSAP
ncbi:MAG: PQQ-binding-like beta-propeller repeat protein [Planctomycetaceae bacterium]|nr:PQQ-binding-like beta-propeller repeat protein [Planctomycetaceae bacterium]